MKRWYRLHHFFMNDKAFETDHDVFTELSRPQLERMADAGAQIVECYRVLQKGGLNIVGEVLKGQGEFYELEYYPKDDVFDGETYSQH